MAVNPADYDSNNTARISPEAADGGGHDRARGGCGRRGSSEIDATLRLGWPAPGPPGPSHEPDNTLPEVGRKEEIDLTSSLAPLFEIADRHSLTENIHSVENVDRANSCKIITDKMDSSRTPFGGRIIFVCFALCNLRLNIVPNHC